MPYLPVMNLVAQHCSNLTQTDIDGLMMSWSVGGYPSPNLELAQCFDSEPTPDRRAGPDAGWPSPATAPTPPRTCWPRGRSSAPPLPSIPSTAVSSTRARTVRPRQSPVFQADRLPRDHGRISLRRSGTDWRAIYPAEVLAGQFEKIAAGWDEGLDAFRAREGKAVTPTQQANLHDGSGPRRGSRPAFPQRRQPDSFHHGPKRPAVGLAPGRRTQNMPRNRQKDPSGRDPDRQATVHV